jgi:hypothetical protein
MTRAFVFVFLLGCSSSGSGSSWNYTVNFESVAAAVSADTLQVDVFDAKAPQADCADLVVARRANLSLPKPAVSVPPTPICSLAGGKGGVSVPFGTYTVLVVAQSKGQDWLIGCNTQYVTKDEDPGTLPIELTSFSDKVQVQGTACQSLSAHCSGGC